MHERSYAQIPGASAAMDHPVLPDDGNGQCVLYLNQPPLTNTPPIQPFNDIGFVQNFLPENIHSPDAGFQQHGDVNHSFDSLEDMSLGSDDILLRKVPSHDLLPSPGSGEWVGRLFS